MRVPGELEIDPGRPGGIDLHLLVRQEDDRRRLVPAVEAALTA